MPDIFGQIMKDASEGGKAIHRIERDDGYTTESEGTQYLCDIADWPESERSALLHAVGPVLDVGCGAGRVGMYLEKNGIQYTGIDISPMAIEVCKKRGLKDVHVMSAERITLGKSDFRTIILFGNNFGVLGEQAKIVDMLKSLHQISTPDAIILAETRDVVATDNPQHFAYHKRNRQNGLPVGQVQIRIHYQEQVGSWWKLLMCSSGDMDRLANEAGWYLERTFGPSSLYVGLLRKR